MRDRPTAKPSVCSNCGAFTDDFYKVGVRYTLCMACHERGIEWPGVSRAAENNKHREWARRVRRDI